jgi:hypothetical protein
LCPAHALAAENAIQSTGPAFSNHAPQTWFLADTGLPNFREYLKGVSTFEINSASPSQRVMESRYEYYRDSRGQAILSSAWAISAWLSSLHLLIHESGASHDSAASDHFRVRSMEGITDLSKRGRLRGEIGIAQTNQRLQGFVGELGTTLSLLSTTLGATVSRGFLDSTGGKEKSVAYNSLDLGASKSLLGRLVVNLDLRHRDYADKNSSNHVGLGLRYALDVLGTSDIVGYRLNYTEFARKTNSSYYQPGIQRLQELYWIISYAFSRFYGSVGLSGYYQIVTGAGATAGDITTAGYGTLGMIIAEGVSLELNESGGNHCLCYLKHGFTYSSTGFTVNYSF